jgi:hypothetical protein
MLYIESASGEHVRISDIYPYDDPNWFNRIYEKRFTVSSNVDTDEVVIRWYTGQGVEFKEKYYNIFIGAEKQFDLQMCVTKLTNEVNIGTLINNFDRQILNALLNINNTILKTVVGYKVQQSFDMVAPELANPAYIIPSLGLWSAFYFEPTNKMNLQLENYGNTPISLLAIKIFKNGILDKSMWNTSIPNNGYAVHLIDFEFPLAVDTTYDIEIMINGQFIANGKFDIKAGEVNKFQIFWTVKPFYGNPDL